FSPVEPWRVLGRKWTDNPGVDALERLYPDPPRVIFVSNNEAHDFRWYNAEKSKYYMERFGEGRSNAFKRDVWGKGWIERYSAMIEGMRSGLSDEQWKENSIFAAYSALGPDHLGRPDLTEEDGWRYYSTATEERVSWEPLAWEGAIPESYDNH